MTPLEAAEKVMAKNWAGFEAKYVEARKNGTSAPIVGRQAALEEHNRRVGDEWLRKQGFNPDETH